MYAVSSWNLPSSAKSPIDRGVPFVYDSFFVSFLKTGIFEPAKVFELFEGYVQCIISHLTHYLIFLFWFWFIK